MSSISKSDIDYIVNTFRFLNLSDDVFANIKVDINDKKYSNNGDSLTDRIVSFWKQEDNQIVGMSILEIASRMRNMELITQMRFKFSTEIEKIGNKIMSYPNIRAKEIKNNFTSDTKDLQSIKLRPEIYEHIKSYWNNGDYFHALEEAYKVVRKKLKQLTNQEKATNAFSEANYPIIFGHAPEDQVEKDFFEGVKFLHMALQCFRNEKAHDLAKPLDKNIAMHYLALASLAYDLISRNDEHNQ